jgi:hydrogenase maturation protein HypF
VEKKLHPRPDAALSSVTGQPGRRVLVRVQGIVQGVGFRPFVYQLALRHGLGGWVRNQPDGVEIEIAGPAEPVSEFIDDISGQAPPLARIIHIETAELPFAPLEGFAIIKSSARQARSTLISPDVCTCGDCLSELLDPKNRRFRYPFTNCTNCGPRYTIIKDIPYDRDKTTMAHFAMCPACRSEYDDPLDRRFHAQPNGCPECGPHVWLETPDGKRKADRDEALLSAVKLLETGSILAIKGLGGFHLAVDATDEAAVSRLRSRKIREEKPFAVMFSSIEEIRRHCFVTRTEEKLLCSQARPIVLLKRRDVPAADQSAHFEKSDPDSKNPPCHPLEKGGAESPQKNGEVNSPQATAADAASIAPGVAPKNRYLGAFLPYTPLHSLLFENAPFRALVMTSGNQSDEPIVMENADARSRLQGIADYFLLHDREIYMRCDDSVIRVLGEVPRPLRRARGYVPFPVFLRDGGPSVLGTGAELKNAICLTRGKEAFLSQHIGDLENLETLGSFEHAIVHLERILEIKPKIIVHDLHPDYLSTQWALRQKGMPLIAVQHHHAHIAAVMAERRLEGPVIGLALDGTGFGTDGTIWGGEVLKVDNAGFERLGHFRQVLLPGGDRAVKEPWRMALSYLWSLDPENVEPRFADILARWSAKEQKIILQMLARRINSPVTSSCGRLFDAVSALCGIRNSVNYEGQAAIELEQALEPDDGLYEGRVTTSEGSGMLVIDPFPMIEAVVEDVLRDCPAGKISARFHNGIVSLLAKAGRLAAEKAGLKQIVFSGGVFQNAYLSERLERELSGMGFDVYGHIEVPANDACIALGQAYIGVQRLR